MTRMTKPAYGLLSVSGWGGVTKTEVFVVETTNNGRARIQAITRTKLGGRDRWLEPGHETMVPEHAVTWSWSPAVPPEVEEQVWINYARHSAVLSDAQQRMLVQLRHCVTRFPNSKSDPKRFISIGRGCVVEGNSSTAMALGALGMVEAMKNDDEQLCWWSIRLTKAGYAALERLDQKNSQ